MFIISTWHVYVTHGTHKTNPLHHGYQSTFFLVSLDQALGQRNEKGKISLSITHIFYLFIKTSL